jgi:hypothetical protein
MREEDTIETALARMKETDSRAVVLYYDDNHYRLFRNNDVVEAWHNKLALCRDLAEDLGQPVSPMTTPLKLVQETPLYTALESMLDQEQAMYGIPFMPKLEDKFATILTRHEGLAYDLLSASKVCVCSGPFRHTDPVPPDNSTTNCRHCGFSYECY